MGQGEKGKLFKGIREIVEALQSGGGVRLRDLRHRTDWRRPRRCLLPRRPSASARRSCRCTRRVSSARRTSATSSPAKRLLDHIIGSQRAGRRRDRWTSTSLGEFNLAGRILDGQAAPGKSSGCGCAPCFPAMRATPTSRAAHTARVNMMVCSTALINLARKMEERWGFPYFEGSFYGVSDTSDALRQPGAGCWWEGAEPQRSTSAEMLIEEEEGRVWSRLKPYQRAARGQTACCSNTGGVKSWSVVSALQEIGIEIVGTIDQEIDRRGQGAHQGAAGGEKPRSTRWRRAISTPARRTARPTSCCRAAAPSSSR